MEFICDERYQNVIEELEKRNWVLITPADANTIPLRCQLIWKKLSMTKFPAVLGRYVNHLKGIHHLSNKSYLVYHLGCSARVRSVLPPTWSSSFQTIHELVGKVLLTQEACQAGYIYIYLFGVYVCVCVCMGHKLLSSLSSVHHLSPHFC